MLFMENKGTDQLRGYHAADLRAPLFSYLQKSGFLMTRLIYVVEGFMEDNYCHPFKKKK